MNTAKVVEVEVALEILAFIVKAKIDSLAKLVTAACTSDEGSRATDCSNTSFSSLKVGFIPNTL